jgi:hypothetical protein
MRLSDLPLWRLLVALDDAERTVGADSPTARALARAVQDRLRKGCDRSGAANIAARREASRAPKGGDQ